MAVSKRTRFEVLRRDNFTCRYCRSSEGELTVDHVTPIALGGTDEPTNLVAACRDCNSGKASTSPDEDTVAQVEEDALRWTAAIAKAAEITDAKAKTTSDLVDWFGRTWDDHTPYFAHLPADYAGTIVNFHSLGLTRTALLEAVEVATSRYGVGGGAMWRYFCGVCWNKVRELQRIAEELLAAEVTD